MYKAGELEALIIMENLGFKLDHNDDNSKESMPDFRFEDGHYLEVTHTEHKMKRKPNNYSKLSLDDQLKRKEEANDAKERLRHISNYVDKPDKIKKDKKIVNDHFGKLTSYCTDPNINSDIISEIYTVDNIISVIEKKSEKHCEGTDLFIFVDNDEYELLINCMTDRYSGLHKSVNNSVFNTVYIYPWDSTFQDYKSTKEIIILRKTAGDVQSEIKELQ